MPSKNAAPKQSLDGPPRAAAGGRDAAAAAGGASALLVVDVQRDFVDPQEGRLAVPGAPSILPAINRLITSGRSGKAGKA